MTADQGAFVRLTRCASAISLVLSLTSCGGGDDGPELATIQVTPNPVAIAQQQTVQLQASVLNDAGQLVTGIPITFRTSNADIASVSNTGLITGGRAGTATVTVEADDLENEVPVTVSAVSNAITLSPNPGVVPQNGTLQLVAQVTDLSGQPVLNPSVTYTSSNVLLATVSATGLVAPVGPAGQVVITATSGTLSTTAAVAITQVPTSIVVIPNPATVGKAATLQFQSSLRDAVDAPITGVTFTYLSSNPSLATVSAGGLLQGLGTVGTLNVTVSSGSVNVVVPVALVEAGSPAGILDGSSPAPAGMLAYGTDVSPAGDILLVGTSNQSAATMARATMSSRTFTSLPITGTFATDVAFTASGNTAWVANIPFANASEVNPATGAIIGSTTGIDLNGTRFTIDIAGDGTVFLAGDQHAYRINPTTRAMVWDAPIGNTGFTLAWSSARQKYYTAGSGGLIDEVDPATGQVRRVSTSHTSNNLAVSVDGARIYSVSEDATVTVLNTASGAIEGAWTLPCDMWGIVLSLDGTKLFASCPYAGKVLMINPADGLVMTEITVGGTPRRISFTRDGLIALVADNDGFVHFIR